VRADLKEAEGRVSSLKIKINTKKALVAQLKDQYLDEEKWIKDKREYLAYAEVELIDTDKRIERLSFWKKGFGPKGVPSLFIETVLPQISKRIQKYADILTGGDVLVDLKAYSETKSNTIKEAIQISAVNTKGAAVYGANSTGERNRIDLAVTLGLIDFFKDTGAFESNLLVCDEIFDGLDATGVEQALIALDKADIPSVIVVSHHEHLKPLFPETLYVQKEHGKAELVV
jgi:DNA repair exonuclease SbcCD ATPase subunit